LFTAPRVAGSKLGATSPGLLFITLFGQGTNSTAPLIMTEQGQLVWLPESSFLAANFGIQELNGIRVINYWNGSINGNIGVGYGSVHILDSAYNTLHEICAADIDIIPF
jgi:hypothetical protein